VVAKTRDKEFQRFRFQQPLARHIVDHKMREIRLAGDGAQEVNSGAVNRTHVIGVPLRIGHAVEFRRIGRRGPLDGAASCRSYETDADLEDFRGFLDIPFFSVAALIDNSPAGVTGEATFSATAACCRSSAKHQSGEAIHDRHRRHHRREILDSRGNPTVEVDVVLEDGSVGGRRCPPAPPPARMRRSSSATATRRAIS